MIFMYSLYTLDSIYSRMVTYINIHIYICMYIEMVGVLKLWSPHARMASHIDSSECPM